MLKTDGAVKPWEQLQEEYGLANKLKFKLIQQIRSLSKRWIEQTCIDLKFDQSCYPRPSLYQKTPNILPQ